MTQIIVPFQRSVVVVADVSTLEDHQKLVKETHNVSGIGGTKVGLDLALGYGLPRLVETTKSINPNSVFIYDHQKGGTDIPDLGRNFANRCRSSGVDAVILFPQSGPATQEYWVIIYNLTYHLYQKVWAG